MNQLHFSDLLNNVLTGVSLNTYYQFNDALNVVYEPNLPALRVNISNVNDLNFNNKENLFLFEEYLTLSSSPIYLTGNNILNIKNNIFKKGNWKPENVQTDKGGYFFDIYTRSPIYSDGAYINNRIELSQYVIHGISGQTGYTIELRTTIPYPDNTQIVFAYYYKLDIDDEIEEYYSSEFCSPPEADRYKTYTIYETDNILNNYYTSAYTNNIFLTSASTRYQSAGVYNKPSLSISGYTIDIGIGDYVTFNDNNFNQPLHFFTLTGGTFNLTPMSVNYVMIHYNSGNSYIMVDTNRDLINQSDVIPIFTLFTTNLSVDILDWDTMSKGLPNKLTDRFVRTERFVVEENSLILGEAPTRLVTLSDGYGWHGAVRDYLMAINSSADTLSYFYHIGGVMTKVTGFTQYNNTQFDNGTDLQNLTGTHYTVNWIYRDFSINGKDIYILLGNNNYQLADAIASTKPVNLPQEIIINGLLVGRIIVQRNATTATRIESALDTIFNLSPVTDHNSLANLQGGESVNNEYYHLSLTQFNNLITSAFTEYRYSLSSHTHSYNTLTDLPDLTIYATTATTFTSAQTNTILTDYVPYTGATTDVLLGNYNLYTPSVIGGTLASGNLTLSSTSNVTKGDIILGNSTYDEANNILTINKDNLNSTASIALDLRNNTLSNSAITQQWSPALNFRGTYLTGGVNVYSNFKLCLENTPTTHVLRFSYATNNNAYNNVFTFYSTGRFDCIFFNSTSSCQTAIQNIVTTATPGYSLISSSVSTAVIPTRLSPSLVQTAKAWNVSTTADTTQTFSSYVKPVSSATPSASISYNYSNNGAANVEVMNLDSSGDLSIIGNFILPKTSGYGIQVDNITPTFPWRDILGEFIPKAVGAGSPALTTYMTGIRQYSVAAADVYDGAFHIPHDWVVGTDMFIHVHWSHNGTAISGTFTMNFAVSYAKGHNQANFTTATATTISYATVNIATTPQFRHRIDEVQLTATNPSSSQINTALIEPDGLIIYQMIVGAIPTITGGTPNNPYIHYIDLHYQSTNIGTKQKTPNFYI